MAFLVNCRSASTAAAPWKNFLITHTSPIDISGDGTWTVNYVSGFEPVFGSDLLGGWPTSGDAAWVNDENAAKSGHRCESGRWNQILITGPANTAFDLDTYAYGPSGRIIEIRLNGGASQSVDVGTPNHIMSFTGTTDGNGEALLEYREGTGSSGLPYLNTFRIEPSAAAVPSISITGDLQPGQSFTVTYADFSGVPGNSLTLTDGGGNTLTLPVTITDNGDGTGTADGTMPALPAVDNNQPGLLLGTLSADLDGVTTAVSYTVDANKTSVTLADPIEPYAFEDWSPLPVAGEQFITTTSEGTFDANGNYTSNVEGVHPIWFIDASGTTYGLTVDSTGLPTVSSPQFTVSQSAEVLDDLSHIKIGHLLIAESATASEDATHVAITAGDLSHSVTARNAMAQAIANLVDQGSAFATPRLVLISDAEVTLAVLNMAVPAFQAPVNGVITANPIASGATLAPGRLARFEVRNRDDEVVYQGAISTSGAAMTVGSLDVTNGQILSVDSLTYSSSN